MGEPAAKKGDRIVALDTHIEMVSSPAGPVPIPRPMPFDGVIEQNVSPSVYVDDQPVVVVGSKATNSPRHIPLLGAFQRSPNDTGEVTGGSNSTMADDQRVARIGDTAQTCDDVGAQNNGTIVADRPTTVIVG